ncbi:MAG: phosphoribosyltransferase family protein [Cytophagales bacterium]|nr:phosphoribosyltransferase family protein [Cytophagales bacterium]
MDAQLILSHQQVIQISQRMAFQIFENHYQEHEMVFAGIEDKGYLFAEAILQEYKAISPNTKVALINVTLDKFSPTQSDISLDSDISALQNKVVVLFDDVLNSGRTLAYSMKPFLNIPIKKLQIAVLVDRGHKSFPVSADYTGYELSTTLKEYIEVKFENKKITGVYLN